MQKNSVHILSTRPIDQSMVNEAAMAGIDLDMISFIETEAITDEQTLEQIRNYLKQPITAVFTSMNAVDAVTALKTDTADWNIGCLGNTTKELVEKEFGPGTIIATGANATELAHHLSAAALRNTVVFFCGDQRRDELPAILRGKGIDLKELTIYRTIEKPVALTGKYDGVAFFSPSAVESFFSVNTLPPEAIVFAIGQTTASAVAQFCTNQVIISASPGKNNLIKTIIDHYTSTAHSANG